MTQDCHFCRRLSAPGDPEVVAEFPQSVIFLGRWQYYHGYCLLVSRRHAAELHELPERDRRAFLEEMCFVARAVCEAFRPHKLNYELLGNQVPHLHWHLFPRYDNDPDRLKPVWLAIEKAEVDDALRRRLEIGPADRLTTAGILREKLNAHNG
jgi:diadenosine tetraphosphate (Ap4A) HIT family hydrolase